MEGGKSDDCKKKRRRTSRDIPVRLPLLKILLTTKTNKQTLLDNNLLTIDNIDALHRSADALAAEGVD